jgi:hypothetical protein
MDPSVPLTARAQPGSRAVSYESQYPKQSTNPIGKSENQLIQAFNGCIATNGTASPS